jgi:hypothetical protein
LVGQVEGVDTEENDEKETAIVVMRERENGREEIERPQALLKVERESL